MGVRETHWAESDRKRMAELGAALPAVLETAHDDWQARVDGGPTPHTPHTYLYAVTALRYAQGADGVWSPTGEEKTYLVTARKGCSAACDAVKHYLANEAPDAPGTYWAFRWGPSQLVLDGDAARGEREVGS